MQLQNCGLLRDTSQLRSLIGIFISSGFAAFYAQCVCLQLEVALHLDDEETKNPTVTGADVRNGSFPRMGVCPGGVWQLSVHRSRSLLGWPLSFRNRRRLRSASKRGRAVDRVAPLCRAAVSGWPVTVIGRTRVLPQNRRDIFYAASFLVAKLSLLV